LLCSSTRARVPREKWIIYRSIAATPFRVSAAPSPKSFALLSLARLCPYTRLIIDILSVSLTTTTSPARRVLFFYTYKSIYLHNTSSKRLLNYYFSFFSLLPPRIAVNYYYTAWFSLLLLLFHSYAFPVDADSLETMVIWHCQKHDYYYIIYNDFPLCKYIIYILTLHSRVSNRIF